MLFREVHELLPCLWIHAILLSNSVVHLNEPTISAKIILRWIFFFFNVSRQPNIIKLFLLIITYIILFERFETVELLKWLLANLSLLWFTLLFISNYQAGTRG